MIREISVCRVSGSPNLITVLSLGHQKLTGLFPRERDEVVTSGPLELVWCPDSGLLQLRHSFSAQEMYGDSYGYRSGLNQSMVDHLRSKVYHLQRLRPTTAGEIVVDIGSNDATTLKAYHGPDLERLGIDPTGAKFRDFYTEGIGLVPDFFSAGAFRERYPEKRASIVTSIAMFYDLEAPIGLHPRRRLRSSPTTGSGTSSRATCPPCCA